MYYSFILLYFLLCHLYFCTLNTINQVTKKMYQNATSKNRTDIKKINASIENRKKIIIVLFWPFYETYLLMSKNKNEWRYFTFRLFNLETFKRRR